MSRSTYLPAGFFNLLSICRSKWRVDPSGQKYDWIWVLIEEELSTSFDIKGFYYPIKRTVR